MTYIQLCAAMQGGYTITLTLRGISYNGRVIGIRPESGFRDISKWLIALRLTNGETTEVYWRESDC